VSLSTVTTTPLPDTTAGKRGARRKAISLVFCCTLFNAAGQILIKHGANSLANADLLTTILGLVRNPFLIFGFGLYGVSLIFLVTALREGELSVLYPVIALSYVWVTILSVALFHESINSFKLIGISTIVLGVVVIGRGKK
jgi:multidrug transporter EmrE-like cation transporter